MKKIISTLAVCTFFSTPLMSQPSQMRSCQDWNTARKANLSSAVQREWLFGYVNGWRDAQQFDTGKSDQAPLKTEDIIEQTNVFCESHPEKNANESLKKMLQDNQKR